jgi:hypothetical protein
VLTVAGNKLNGLRVKHSWRKREVDIAFFTAAILQNIHFMKMLFAVKGWLTMTGIRVAFTYITGGEMLINPDYSPRCC